MSYQKISQYQSQLIIGTKQTLKAIQKDDAYEVFVAMDADPSITSKVIDLSREKNIPCRQLDSKKKLGAACGVEVDTATVAIKKS